MIGDPGAIAGLLRRSTIICRSIEQSLRFWRVGLLQQETPT